MIEGQSIEALTQAHGQNKKKRKKERKKERKKLQLLIVVFANIRYTKDAVV